MEMVETTVVTLFLLLGAVVMAGEATLASEFRLLSSHLIIPEGFPTAVLFAVDAEVVGN